MGFGNDTSYTYSMGGSSSSNIQFRTYGKPATGTYNVVGYFSSLMAGGAKAGQVSIVYVLTEGQWWSLTGGTCKVTNDGTTVTFEFENVTFSKQADETITVLGSGNVSI